MSTRKRAKRVGGIEAGAYLEKLLGPVTLAKALRATREGEGLSQVDFAGRLGISKSHLCDIEQGRKLVSPARAADFAKRLGYSVEQYVGLALQDEVDRAGLGLRVNVRVA